MRLKDRAVETKDMNEMSETHSHRGNLAICRRSLFRATDSEEEQGQEREDISECRVYTIIVLRNIVPNVVQPCHCIESQGELTSL
jgi:hypothetical protein